MSSLQGSSVGVNIVDLSFGDYSGGLGGLEAPEEVIRSSIHSFLNHALDDFFIIFFKGGNRSCSRGWRVGYVFLFDKKK